MMRQMKDQMAETGSGKQGQNKRMTAESQGKRY